MSRIRFENQTTPATPPAGKVTVFVDSADKKAKQIDDAGLVTDLTAVPAGGAVTTTNINWVDKSGDDGAALVNRFDLPWLTIGAALTAAASGDVVMVRPGTYAESGLTVPAGVALISEGGFLLTIVGDAAAVAHIITLSAGSYLQGFQILCPTTASLAGVSHSAGTGTIYDLDLRGDGATGSGDGIYKTGTGKVVGGHIR